MLHRFRFAAPRRRSELLELLADAGGRAKLLAGGTDLLVNVRYGNVRPEVVVDLKRVEGWSGLSWADEGLILRPAVTINELLRDPAVHHRYPLLAACAHDLASYQIRNRATVIGNVVNASPCSDMAPGLLCLDARAVIASTRGEREVPFSAFFTGVKRTVLQPDEVLERIVVPREAAEGRAGYRKLKRIAGHDLGIIGVALLRRDGRVRLGISSSAPTPVLVDWIDERAPEEEVVTAALRAIHPISDLRCSKEYRTFMVEVYVKRLLAEVRS